MLEAQVGDDPLLPEMLRIAQFTKTTCSFNCNWETPIEYL